MKPNNIPVNLLIVDDHKLVIEGLKDLLSGNPEIRIADGVTSGEAALRVMLHRKVDVVLADVSMPGMTGIELTRKIKEKFPAARVIGITMHNDASLITQMLNAGAAGYVFKNSNYTELCNAILRVGKGESFLSPEIQEIIFKGICYNAAREKKTRHKSVLSLRETEIVNMIARNLPQSIIAQKIGVNEKTFEIYQRNIFAKTKTHNREGLIRYAIKYKLGNDQ